MLISELPFELKDLMVSSGVAFLFTEISVPDSTFSESRWEINQSDDFNRKVLNLGAAVWARGSDGSFKMAASKRRRLLVAPLNALQVRE